MAKLSPQSHEAPASAAEEKARALFEASPLPLWVYDLETLRILDVNEVACSKYGYTRDEFLALTIRDLRPLEDVAAMERSVLETPPQVHNSGIWRHRLRDGTLIAVEITSHEMLFDGRRTRFVCPIDVTQRLRAEAALREREAALRRAQGLARLAHAVTGEDGAFESWSESLPALIGAARTHVPASTREWLALIHPDDRARFRDRSIEAATIGVRVDVEYRLLRPGGGLMHLRHVIEPVLDAQGVAHGRWFSTVQDVTAQKDAEARVREANDALERRVRERTFQLEVSNRDLELAKAAAERANRAKSEFLASMSHELRTPLNAIIGFGQLLAMPEVMARENEQRAVFVDHIVDAGRHLLTLINEILNLSQIEAGKVELQLERVALGDLLDECDAMTDPLAAQRGISMRFPARCDIALRADRMRLKQVLLNLLSNAIKYNRDGGTVQIECAAADGRARIHVRDTGQGLTPEQLAGLFQAFNRLGREGGTSEGSGIGLVVTRRLVELMGGTIGVASSPGVGSDFHIELPQAESAIDERARAFMRRVEPWNAGWAPVPSPRPADLAAPGRATVLCVDDDPASLGLVERMLSALPGVDLLAALDGRRGVELAQAHVPALIVMGGNLPGPGGREARALLQADPRTAGIPVIALGANAMPGAADASLQAGFFRYLTRPFDVGELLQAVGDALGKAGNAA